MKIIGINGSPRKNHNTGTLLKSALEGAAAQWAQTELINLYDLNYKGCISCFSCKLTGGKYYGTCAVKDDLKPILEKIEECDGLIIGAPIYFGMISSGTRAFLERLMFQYLVYDKKYTSIFHKKINTGFIYTMNVNQIVAEQAYVQTLRETERSMKRTFGECEALFVTDTYQFDDYSKYETSAFNAQEKKKRHDEVFPEDCKKAFEMGVRFATSVGL